MRGAVLYGTGDVRFEEVPEPKIIKPTDAIIRLSATCVCGSDLWSYRGISPVNQPTPMGHEYCGIVEEVGSAVKTVNQASSSSAPSLLQTTPALTATLAISPPAMIENS
jgi:threonine dehydrogenase-like Zn-dependent dehydrogenase